MPGTIELNISWPSSFFGKGFMAPPSMLISHVTLIRLGFLRVVFSGGGRAAAVNLTPLHISNLSNINITLYSC